MAISHRTYNDVKADLEHAYEARRRALRAEETAAGDKRVRRNLKSINETIKTLEQEINQYDPATGAFRGRRVGLGVPCY